MKNLKLIFVFGIFIFVVISCGTKIRTEDKKYIPYNGDEILIFKSNQNELDAIFLTGISKFNACYEPLSLFKPACDGRNLSCKKSDSNSDRYLPFQSLMSISKIKNKTYIGFSITLRHSWFYEGAYMNLIDFKKLPNFEMKIGDKIYNDVKIIKATNKYIESDNYVERFYWSETQGFLGLDQRNRNWRLIKINN
jgi:hypothetical protein